MNQINRVSSLAPVLAPDMGLELAHWRSAYPHAPCFKSGLGFERYAATFKFACDTYVLNHRKSEEELFPRLCHQYKDGVAACDRIDWVEAKSIIDATWDRLRTVDSHPVVAPLNLRPPLRALRPSPSTRFLSWNWWPMQALGLHASSTAPRQALAC
jgi:hypothetical protein